MANWERLAEQSQLYTASDFEGAAYRLLREQVLYATDHGSRKPYDLVVKYLPQFRELLGQVGVSVVHNSALAYVVAIPNQNVGDKMRLSETRLALILRRLYDDKMHATEVLAGEAFIDLIELERAYKELLGRDLPDTTDLREQMDALKRYGIARREDVDGEQPFMIVIRPGIVDVLGETALLQLTAYADAAAEEDRDEAP
ncbi:DUF4194 domain-containing protein [Luteibacter aegosomatis]|uniref:DUF4194 domain-containing protein n=1 Tax=Luteibacter aegosomatis TaxID=2911537 RepID=UPI001FF84606|nr:DUF4194 domain-containing protein [Luteibacter aegosomatis]UPG83887.1 DUF4194 domain-containing protein [Luteibacter aegosomatis]